MLGPRAATIGPALEERLTVAIQIGGAYLNADSFEFKWLLRECDKLAKADAYHASLAKCWVWQLAGNLDEALYWVSNASKFPEDGARSSILEAAVHVNLGYFSRGAGVFDGLPPDLWSNREEFSQLGLLCGSFGAVIEAAEGMQLAEEELPLVETARRCAMVMKVLGVSENKMRAVLDAAGEVLRRHQLYFSDNAPVVYSIADEDGAGVLYQLRIRADARTADQLTDEVIDLMIERELAGRGLNFSFIPQL